VTALRDRFRREAGSPSLDELRHDYSWVRAGDLASLAFCTMEDAKDPDGCPYSMRLSGSTLSVAPDPFGGREIPIEIRAREIEPQTFDSAESARRVVCAARVVTVRGTVKGD
jgi:hypothetical protein